MQRTMGREARWGGLERHRTPEGYFTDCTAPTREQWAAGLADEVWRLRRLLNDVDETVVAKVVAERNALREKFETLLERALRAGLKVEYDEHGEPAVIRND